ncbi:MAG: helix-turn-helix transcriptional regulator [Clostridia bacterium]|nr:helix-turn-helix transcriptional regulator [Clostridia bacterium]
MDYGLRLKTFRCANGMTQQHIADALGISRAAYCNYEIGRRSPDADMLVKLADFYNTSLDEMFKCCTSGCVAEEDAYENDVGFAYVSQLSKDEIDLIAKYRVLNSEDKKEIIKITAEKMKNR